MAKLHVSYDDDYYTGNNHKSKRRNTQTMKRIDLDLVAEHASYSRQVSIAQMSDDEAYSDARQAIPRM